MVELVRYSLISIPGVRYVLTEHLCQDLLEAFLGRQRMNCGRNNNPNVKTFYRILCLYVRKDRQPCNHTVPTVREGNPNFAPSPMITLHSQNADAHSEEVSKIRGSKYYCTKCRCNKEFFIILLHNPQTIFT